ncbi:MAG: hypothetical protein R6U61_04950 [Thermoplasmata archaeon]
MGLKGVGTVYENEKNGRMIYVPSIVGNDSEFPFEKNEKVEVRIDENQLIVRRKKERGKRY